MQKKWQGALGKMTYGIYVLTTCIDSAINGMIASWVMQVSHEPPLIIVAVHPNRYTHSLLEQSGSFALHVIDRNRKDFLKRFKGTSASEKFINIRWREGATGCPILSDCIAWFECRIIEKIVPGNHALFIGEISDAGLSADGVPLTTLDYEGVYTGRN